MRALDQDIGYLLHRTEEALRARLLVGLAAGGVSFPEYKVLVQLAFGDNIPQNVLAERMNLEKSVLARTLRRLEKQQLFRRMPDKADARVKRVVLTPKGRALQQQIIVMRERHLDAASACLTEREVQELQRLLNRLYEYNLDAVAPVSTSDVETAESTPASTNDVETAESTPVSTNDVETAESTPAPEPTRRGAHDRKT
jgi:DNA-binding MarR family transcriptional regulator